MMKNPKQCAIDKIARNPVLFEFDHQVMGAEMSYPVIFKYRTAIDEILAGVCKGLSRNPHPAAVEFLMQHPDKIDWVEFRDNQNQQVVGYTLLRQLLDFPEHINWEWFSSYENQQAVECLLRHPLNIDWYWFSYNESQLAVEYQ